MADPAHHGEWEIVKKDDGGLQVRMVADGQDPEVPPMAEMSDERTGSVFAAEAHLRDYLVRHLDDIEPGLILYADDEGTDGVEFRTDIGRIDILARDARERFVVIELKVAQGPDTVCGQLMRYMSWVKRRLADGNPVRGMIVAQHISDKIRYALADVEGVQLKEYEIFLQLKDVESLDKPAVGGG